MIVKGPNNNVCLQREDNEVGENSAARVSHQLYVTDQ